MKRIKRVIYHLNTRDSVLKLPVYIGCLNTDDLSMLLFFDLVFVKYDFWTHYYLQKFVIIKYVYALFFIFIIFLMRLYLRIHLKKCGWIL